MSLMTPLEYRLREDLKFSKSTYMPWGRQVIRAIDFDDCVAMVQVFETKAVLGAHVDVQATSENYGGYVWSAWITNFVGDTALHMAVRQKKMKCAYMLIAMGALTDIENSRGQTAEDLITKSLNMTIRQMELDAFRVVIPQLDPSQFKYLPKRSSLTHVNFPTVEREAWDMMMSGRNLYVETPSCFAYDDIIPDPKAPGKPRPRKWATRYDAKTKRKYRVDAYSGDIEWLAEEEKKQSIKDTPVVLTAPPPSQKKNWSMAFDESGNKYYFNSVTGETQWEMPDALKSKAQLEKETKERKKKERAEQGLSDSDDEYQYTKKGDSDSEDEEEKIRALKEKHEKEEQERLNAEQQRKEREREEWARRNQEKRKAQRQHENTTGVNICAGAVAVGDVWGKNRVTDTIRLLHKQRIRQQRMNEADAHRLSGLTLMNAANQEESPGISRELLHGLRDMKGIQRLRFGKLKELHKIAKEIDENPDPRADLELPYRFVDTLSTRTNLKSMIVSDFGIQGIANELVDDKVIVNMELFGAGISLKGCQALAKTLPTMRSLTALDLSANAIDDEAAIALADGLLVINEGATVDYGYDNNPDDIAVAQSKAKYGSLLGHVPLVKLSLSGNRITLRGATAIVEAALDDRSTLRFVSLTNNFLRREEREELSRLAGPHHDYTRGQQRYAKRYEFPGPGGKIMKWPFHIYPFPKHPMHASNNPSQDEIDYFIKVENGNKPLSGVFRGDAWPERGTWQPLELRERLINRKKAKLEKIRRKFAETAEIRLMNVEDRKHYQLSSAEWTLFIEQMEKETCEAPDAVDRDSPDAPMEHNEEGKDFTQYTEEEIASDPVLRLELAALKDDSKVTSMTKKGEKILRASPRGTGEARRNSRGTNTDEHVSNDLASPLKSALKKENMPSEISRQLHVTTPSERAIDKAGSPLRKVFFQDEVPLDDDKRWIIDEKRERTGEEDYLLQGDEGSAVNENTAIERERKVPEGPDLDEVNVSAFDQELLAPGKRGPAHLRQLDILI